MLDSTLVMPPLKKQARYMLKVATVIVRLSSSSSPSSSLFVWKFWESAPLEHMAASYSGVWGTLNSYYEVAPALRPGMQAWWHGNRCKLICKPLTPGAVNRLGVWPNSHSHYCPLYVGVAPDRADFYNKI